MKLKKLAAQLPLLGIFLIILGYLKLYFYYDHWNIAIIDYLDISEITLLFLSDVHIILAFIGIFFFPVVMGLALIQYFENREKKKELLKAIQPIQNPKPQYMYSAIGNVFHEIGNSVSNEGKGLMMIVCLVFAIITICLFYSFNKIWLLYFAIANFMQFMLVLTEYIFGEDDKLSTQLTFVVSAIAFSVFVAHYDICKTELNTNHCETTVVTNDSTIITSENILYIGKTNNYVFIYDVLGKTSRTIKTESVKEIQVRQK